MMKDRFESITLTHQESQIVDYIKKHPDCILQCNAKELAQLAYVSSPTIVRFVKKLGFKGYLDFQLNYTQDYMLQKHAASYQLHPESSTQDVMAALPQIYDRVLKDTQKQLQHETVTRVINYMLQAKQIDFYANDNNFSEVQSACLKLNTLGIRAQAFNTLSQHYIATIQPQDVLSFVVSHSGKNQTMIDAAYALRKKRSRVIAITGLLDPSLDLVCNESLYMSTSLYHLPSNIMLYGLSLHYIIDTLITILMIKKQKI